MAGGNQNQGRRNEGHNPNNGGLRQQASSVTDNLRQGAEAVGNRLQEGYSAARDEVSDRYRQAGVVVSQNPASSVFVGLGLGFGLGLILSTMVGRREETWAERNLPDSLLGLPGQLQRSRAARSLREAPDALHHTFDHIAASLRDLPSAIARAIPKH